MHLLHAHTFTTRPYFHVQCEGIQREVCVVDAVVVIDGVVRSWY